MQSMADPDAEPRKSYHHGNLREALVEATLSLIEAKGPFGFTLAEAARVAGVSAAAPYRHFKGREDLIEEAARQGFLLFADQLERAYDDGRPSSLSAFLATGQGFESFPAHHNSPSASLAGCCSLQPSEQQLHHGDVEPPVELAADLALDTDEFESARGVEAARGISGRLDPGDDRVETRFSSRCDEVLHQETADPTAAVLAGDIDAVFDRGAVGGAFLVRRQRRESDHLLGPGVDGDDRSEGS